MGLGDNTKKRNKIISNSDMCYIDNRIKSHDRKEPGDRVTYAGWALSEVTLELEPE